MQWIWYDPLHVKVVSGYVKDALERKLKCKLCDKAFAHLRSLQRHKRTHTGEKLYKYNKGDKAFASINTLQNPETKLYHRKKPYKCVAKFWHFMVVYTWVELLVCNWSVKAFVYHSNLWEPERTHTCGNLTIKDLAIHLHSITQDYLLWRKKDLTNVNNLFKHYDISLLPLSANSCDKSSVDLSKLTLLDFMLQLHEITHLCVKLYGCVTVPFLLLW